MHSKQRDKFHVQRLDAENKLILEHSSRAFAYDEAGNKSGEAGRASNARLDWGNREPWKSFKQRRDMVKSVVQKGPCNQGAQ